MLYEYPGIRQVFGIGDDVFGKVRVADFNGAL
jgi:hypothetical protein